GKQIKYHIYSIIRNAIDEKKNLAIYVAYASKKKERYSLDKRSSMDRRFFLKTTGIGLASFGFMTAAPDFLHQFASAQTAAKGYGKKKVLVTIFQRGAVDGLNVIVPHGDSEDY